ncbi:putative steroid 17-alpha-hydroxylase/17,20 lyase [Apostichopus japonicus]|uniref:Steroid 21-hydroxylase n=1 Tax=Stichopus japonicus TaxID=307972 RepID=A0A2G8L6V8_STIJA|nr:putative steroid 17-alpha-hydroxylase/17,20 lyase [Apostichopus japonicus]
MFFIELVLFVGILLIVHKYVTFRRRFEGLNLPPNPPALPFIGNMAVFMSGRAPYYVMKDLSDKYGEVFSLKMGTGLYVVLSSAEAIREAFVKKSEDFAGRPYMYSISLLTRNNSGIVFGDYSPVLQLHRKTTAIALQNNARGINCIPYGKKIAIEVGRLVEDLSVFTGQKMDISMHLSLALLNVICEMTFSERYEADNPEFQEILVNNDRFTSLLQPGDPIDVIPALKIFPSKKLRVVQECVESRDQLLQRKYDEHIATFDPLHIRDLTDAFLAVMLESKDENANKQLSEDHVIMAMWEIFIGGFESTYTTLKWAIAYLIHYPEVQKRIQQDLDDVIGDSPITANDKPKLPYLEATVLETLRHSSFSSMNGPRRTTCDTKVAGFDVPKDATVFCNLWWVHHNPKYWAEPDKFRPEHFLNEAGELQMSRAFFPFSIGKRACLGASLAKMQLCLFLGGLLQRYTFTCPPGEPMPNLEPNPELVRIPHSYKLMLVERKC